MWKYLRFFSITGLLVLAAWGTAMGGYHLWLTFLVGFVFVTGGDAVFGDDDSEPAYAHPWILNLSLYSTLPLLLLISFLFAWQLSDRDLFGLGNAVASLTGRDVLAIRAANSWFDILGAVLGIGLIYGGAGTVVAHELTHRTWSKPAMLVGRWMLALTGDASFAIEHVYGHHKNVATRQDPATARRGESAWAFVLRSTIQSYLHAWTLETERLARLGHSQWSWRNRMHRGNGMTLSYLAFFAWAASWQGALIWIATAIYGKGYLEFVNYVEHYGLVRVPGAPVEPRHSWNCNKRVSSYLLYNLTRHSHHHAQGEMPFWRLKAYPDTPMLPAGYLTMIVIAAVPPLFNRIMIPRVQDWDRRFAAPSEREHIEEANRLSGHPWFAEGLPQADAGLTGAA